MKAKLILLALLLVLAWSLPAQVQGSLQQIGQARILQVWGNHYERGFAQGYFLAPEIMTVFNDFYWMMYTYSDIGFYNQLQAYSQQHFDYAQEMYFEVVGIAEGMAASGANIHHQGLGRNLATDDLLLLNTVYDMVGLQGGKKEMFKLGCASLSSWGVATQYDSLLAGSSVITRFLDITQNSALISNPLMVVHHPEETNEQPWLGFTFPGICTPMTVLSSSGIFASMNTGSDNNAPNPTNLSPILWDMRLGVERIDYDQNGSPQVGDILAAVASGNHLSGSIIHTLQESGGQTGSIVIETKNGVTQARSYNQNGSLPTHHLAATNHFRSIANPACCNRYTNIQDSLYANPHINAKRQWQVLSGAAGLETTVTAVQYTPSTGNLLWSMASLSEPAHLRPAMMFDAQELFSFNVANDDSQITPAGVSTCVYPNPWSGLANLQIKAALPIAKVEIYNLKGQLVYAAVPDLNRGNVSLPLETHALPTGIYLIRSRFADGRSHTARFIRY